MHTKVGRGEKLTVRRPFEAWSIAIPSTFTEAFVVEGGYWHAYDDERSVSLTSVILTEEGILVPAESILAQLGTAPLPEGTPLATLPPGLGGCAVEAAAMQPARASRTVSGMLATDGRVLIATITGDDLEWARDTWLSIRAHQAPLADACPEALTPARFH